MEPWYKVVTARKEVREGRSFNPDEFAIALEQVVAGTAPLDYRDPAQFFTRTCFTRALREHAGHTPRPKLTTWRRGFAFSRSEAEPCSGTSRRNQILQSKDRASSFPYRTPALG